MYRRFYQWGSMMAGRAADLSGHPVSIVLVAAFCTAWFFAAGAAGENLLTLILSVVSITLTQMVLNGQRRSERALHLKMDELVITLEGARNEIAGVEQRTDDELEELRRDMTDCDRKGL